MEDKMNVQEEMEDAILPEGYDGTQDFFALDEDETQTIEAPEGMAEQPAEETPDEVQADTNGETVGENSDEPEETPAEESSDPTIDQDATRPKLKVKYNHEEMELDEAEAITYVQKGMNYDKVAQRAQQSEAQLQEAESLARSLGYDSVTAMIADARKGIEEQRVQKYVEEDGVPEPMARFLVRTELEKESEAFRPVQTAPAQPEAAPQVKTKLVSDADVKAFVRAYPGVTKLPPEVITSVRAGENLTAAYARYEAGKAKSELKIVKQNQAAAEKAPVSGVTKNGITDPKKKDPFEMGFDDDTW